MKNKERHAGKDEAPPAESFADLKKRLRGMVGDVVSSEVMELVDLQYVNAGGRWTLRVFVDKPGGVTVDDCANLSRRLSDVLDTEDAIPHRYYLEVSSPGVERAITGEKDFIRFAGKVASIKTFSPVCGQRRIVGLIEDCKEGMLTLRTKDGELLTLPLSGIERANLKFDVWRKK
ncbi:MAG: ribosome maturation factor RimP [Candidatus Eisenbacteria bacterium]|nr:ribosome maturation factor RimP [Candidatus Eisenbacteria bacterium]